MIRDVIEQTMRRDIADRALAWLDQRIDAHKRLTGHCSKLRSPTWHVHVAKSGLTLESVSASGAGA
jgi:hypothetical protein